MRDPSFTFAGAGPLSRRPSGWSAWGDVLKTFVYALITLAAVVALAVYSGHSWSQETCWSWGGSNSASQGHFIKCPPQAPTVVTVTKTEVREVKVPVPVVVPAPAAAPAPAPKIRN